jgi:hypothetical protein
MILSFFNNFSSLLLRTQISFIPLFVLIQKVEQKNQGDAAPAVFTTRAATFKCSH